MNRRALLSAAAGALVSACASGGGRSEAETAMAPVVRAGFTGSVLVACGAGIVFARDYGVSDPAGRTPSYWVASISKQFTAAAALRLRELGRLRLEQPIADFFPDAPEEKRAITLMQLMTHRSGLQQVYAADGVADRAGAVRRILAGALGEAPGARFRYSNDNYTLVAAIIEIVAGEPFETVVAREAFARAELQQAGFWPHAGGDFLPPLMAPIEEAEIRAANWGFRGGTGMRCSVPDLHRWVAALDEGRVLTPESLALLYGPHVRAGDGVGFNWFHSRDAAGRALLWTRGTESYGANAILYRAAGTPLIIAAATHAGPAEGDGWSRRARDVLLAAYPGAPCG
ncbi:MAG: serine hydrolase domain-containing protein [Hyphomonadaceae bacterium]